MADKKKTEDVASDNPSTGSTEGQGQGQSSGSNPEDVFRPFQEASTRFLQANAAAQEAAVKQSTQAWLDYQEQVRTIEQEAYNAVMELTRKHVNRLGEQNSGRPEEAFFARAQAQLDYERGVQQVYIDSQARLNSVLQQFNQSGGGGEGGGQGGTRGFARSGGGESGGEGGGQGGGNDALRQLANQRQEAYQTYLSDLQQAWANTRSLDPQTISAIATHIQATISQVG